MGFRALWLEFRSETGFLPTFTAQSVRIFIAHLCLFTQGIRNQHFRILYRYRRGSERTADAGLSSCLVGRRGAAPHWRRGEPRGEPRYNGTCPRKDRRTTQSLIQQLFQQAARVAGRLAVRTHQQVVGVFRCGEPSRWQPQPAASTAGRSNCRNEEVTPQPSAQVSRNAKEPANERPATTISERQPRRRLVQDRRMGRGDGGVAQGRLTRKEAELEQQLDERLCRSAPKGEGGQDGRTRRRSRGGEPRGDCA